MAGEGGEGLGALQEVQERGANVSGTLDLLKLELVAPDDDRPPDELVGGDDDGDHDEQAPGHGGLVAGAGCRLQERSQAGETKVARAEDEHLTGHEEKPAAGDRNHGIPDKSDGGVRQFELQETLQRGKLVDGCRLGEFARDRLNRRVEGEGHVPHLASKDQDDGTHLDADLARGEKCHHGEHDAREEAEDGDGLQYVEGGDHEGFYPRAVSGGVAVGDCKNER